MPVFWCLVLDLVFLVHRSTSSGVFWGVCELSMLLGSFSANEWYGVHVLVVVCHGASSTGIWWPLGGPGINIEMEISLSD